MAIQPQDRFFDAAGIRLHALVWGEPSAPPLVLLHGFMDHAHAWDFVAERLAEKYRIIALDFRGFGDSAGAPSGAYQFADYLVDVAALWREFELRSALVAGHSMGGNVGSQWAGLYPSKVSKLVLVEGFGPPPRNIEEGPARTRRWVEGLLQAERKHPRVLTSLEEVAARLQESHPGLTDERGAYLAVHATRQTDEGFVWKFDPAHRLPNPHPYREDEYAIYWQHIAAPVLALHGEEGPFSFETMEHRYKHIPKLSKAVIPGAAHGIHIEQPEALAEAMEKFFGEA